MTEPPTSETGEPWQRLEDHEREQFRDYCKLIVDDPEAIADPGRFNPDRRREFARLLGKALAL